MHLVCKDETDDQNIDMKEEDSDLDFGIVPGHISREWYENNGDEEGDVNPEQTGINYADEMELTMMTQPEARKNQKSGDKNKELWYEIENQGGQNGLSLGYCRSGRINAQYEEGHCNRKDTIDHCLHPGF
jgi:hypothetical protein